MESRLSELADAQEVDSYFHLNVTSALMLNNAFLQCTADISERFIVNLSSGVSYRPVPGINLYGAGTI